MPSLPDHVRIVRPTTLSAGDAPILSRTPTPIQIVLGMWIMEHPLVMHIVAIARTFWPAAPLQLRDAIFAKFLSAEWAFKGVVWLALFSHSNHMECQMLRI